jgi:hypothetical protein
MFEVLMILLYVPFLFIYFSFPVFFKIKNSFFYKINIFDILIINSIIHINLLLLLSFVFINSFYLFLIIFLISNLFFILRIKNYFYLFQNNLIIFSLFFFILICFFIKVAHDPILAWDGAHHWIMKAKVFFDGGYIKNIKGVIMDYYPHLGTYIWGFFWKNSYLQIEYFGRFLFVFFFIICFFSCFYNLKFYPKLNKCGLIIALIYFSSDWQLFKGYQEYLLFFCFYVCSRIFIIFEKSNLIKKNVLFYILLYGFTTNIFLWTKQEGFFHFIIINSVFLIHSKINFSYKFIYTSLILIFILIFFLIKIYFFGSFHFHEDILKPSLLENFNPTVFLTKLILITKYIFISFFKNPIWLIILLSIIFLLKIKNTRSYFKENFFIISFVFLEFCLIYAIFIIQSADLSSLLPLTLSRVMFPISGFLIFIISDTCHNIKKNFTYRFFK